MLYHKLLFFVKISIHAPAKGSTKKFGTVEYAKEISIHAPARGATKGAVKATNDLAISIHAPAKGATVFFQVISRFKIQLN